MAYLGTAGNTSEVQDDELNQERGFGVMPEGWYRCALIEDETFTKDWGIGLNMQFQVISGDYENRRLFKFLCLEHTTPKVQHIARVQLKEFSVAAGHRGEEVEDTTPLYNKPVMIQVYRGKEANEKYQEEDGKKTMIGGFMSIDQWKAEKSDEPTPGLERKKQTPAQESAPPPPDDDIPF